MRRLHVLFYCFGGALFAVAGILFAGQPEHALTINPQGYYESPGVNVILFDDFYPDGHQGGLTIVQCGRRIAANGDVRLEPTPGQWAPVPAIGARSVDRAGRRISVQLWFPDSSKNKKGFNPIDYPDLRLHYTVRTEAAGGSIRLIVDLDRPLPDAWAHKVGFNLELFPGELFGEHFLMDDRPGIFPRQANDQIMRDSLGDLVVTPLATGSVFTMAPGVRSKKVIVRGISAPLQLIDERGLHNNGWFVLRSTINPGATTRAVEWLITPTPDDAWRYPPVVQVSQVGYHPNQSKFAVIELDKRTDAFAPVRLIRITADSQTVVKSDPTPVLWGNFLRYRYIRFDFSEIADEGLYKISYGATESNEFEIRRDLFARNVWQPTLEYFLPVQMC
ncbi:MAG TPA: cellulase N-terminal Ig-like domain-containing protein, partial [Bacteroidota bacterium]|nr:cellulase N-terminal Ig-like domain-containing protein [Bacteroidota bacterium]